MLVGRNGEGKTSILEAMYTLAVARAFRVENEYEVVNWAASEEDGNALVGGTVQKGDEKLKIYIGYQGLRPADSSQVYPGSKNNLRVRKEIRVSRIKRTATELVGLVNVVLFTAQDIELVQGPPSLRRRYMDILISQVDRPYLKSLQRYQRVLQQRNRLLRALQEKRAEEDELEFWNRELVNEGSSITSRRAEAMASLSDFCRENHAELATESETLVVEYKPSVPIIRTDSGEADIRENFLNALESRKDKEKALGMTVVGPHRDDFCLLIDGRDMGKYASRGQARTLALTLRLAEAAYLSASSKESPVVLLDDVLSELDPTRRSCVLAKTGSYVQVIISTTELDAALMSGLPAAVYFQVEGGSVSRLTPPRLNPQ